MLQRPLAGLGEVAHRVDLWPIVERLGGLEAARVAPPADWWRAGLPASVHPHRAADAPRVVAGDDAWPPALVGLPFGPVALHHRGNLARLRAPAVAIVGARACTGYGRAWASRLAQAVAEAGGVVVSGLARGIDAAAHAGAGGATVAVLGQGLDAPLPAWQARLADQILARGGLLLSEYAPRTPPDAWTFPVRNRVVAGLARAVVVVEAGHRSGARNTARHALTAGREVLAVPGPLGAEASAGCLDLLEEGATMVRGPATVLAAAGLQAPPEAAPTGPDAALLQACRGGATPEALAGLLGEPLGAILARLGALQAAGRVRREPGQRYVSA